MYKPTGSSSFSAYDPSNPPTDVSQTTTDQGKTVPYIVRIEKGTADRGIYEVAVLSDPSKPWSAFAAQPGGTLTDSARDPAIASMKTGKADAVLVVPAGYGASLAGGSRTIPEMVRAIYRDTNPILWPAAARQVLAYLIALEDEGRVRSHESGREMTREDHAILNPAWESIVGREHAATVEQELGGMHR